jgi:DNA-binding NarL/FixJ family response regulator
MDGGVHLRAVAAPVLDRDGNMIGGIEQLQNISRQKHLEHTVFQIERDLRVLIRSLEAVKAPANISIHNLHDDKSNVERYIQANFVELISPYLERLKKGRIDKNQKYYIDIIESTIKSILSPFVAQLTQGFVKLTPMEIQVADLIRSGKSNKEIAEILHVATRTVETHRYNLRTKLGIINDKVNLRSYLMSLG